MRHLQTYRIFESTQTPTDEQKKFLDQHTDGTWSLNSQTGKVDVDGGFRCDGENLEDFKGISFGSVSKNFVCSNNSLRTLEGAPRTVGGNFVCFKNSLQTLEGAPETVGGNFVCFNNSLQTLEGAPRTVGESFYCDDNSLRTLKGAPRTVGGSFYCDHNLLQTLEGAPRTIGEEFNCSINSLQTLEGAPETVGGNFECSYNPLQTLEGAPKTIGGDFHSDDLRISQGEWSQETLIRIFMAGTHMAGTPKEKQMVAPLIDPETIQKMIDRDPEKMLVKLKDYLKDPHFKDLRWPERLEGEKGLLSDLSDVGL